MKKDEGLAEILILVTVLIELTVKNLGRESRKKNLNYNSIDNSALLC